MNPNVMKVYLLVLMVCVFSLFGCLPKKEVNKGKCDFSPINQLVTSWVDSGYYNGAGLFIAKDSQVILDTCYGSYTPDTVVFIASSGKWLAAATIAAVVDEGKLSWDDRVNKWLPEFTDIKGTATLRQLLSHTSGYPDYQPNGVAKDNYQTLEESVSHIVGLNADTVPGCEFHYGGLAMQVAGRIAELATNKDWETLFQEKIAKPLGMKNTHFTPVDSGGGHSPMLAGGARSVLHDYANFLKMIFHQGIYDGERVLSAKAIAEMQNDQVDDALINRPEYVEKVRAEMHHGIYGLGEWREELDAEGKADLISSPGWAGAYPWIDYSTNTYGFFITHVNVHKASEAGFSSFYSSPVLPVLVRDMYKKVQLPDSVTTGYISTDDASLYYEEVGTGEPVIFIHGHSFNHSEWDDQFFEFGKDYRVIRYDCRGYGRSSLPVEGHHFMHVNDLMAIMDSLKIEKAHLVGMSMGGFIVTDMLALHQNRILSATAASGDVFPVPGPSEPWSEEGMAIRRKEIRELKRKGTMIQKWKWFAALMKEGGSQLEEIRRPVWDMIYAWNQWQPLHVEPRLVLGNDVINILKNQEVTVPVMVLVGEIDTWRQNKLKECVPCAKMVVIPDAGHVSNLEQPQVFNVLVKNFMKRRIN